MQKLFTSAELQASDRYRKWLEFSDTHFMPMVYTRTDEDVFDAFAQGFNFGDLIITHVSFNALKLEANRQTIRHSSNNTDELAFGINFSGKCIISQYDRTVKQGDGDISIIDANEPFELVHLEKTDHLCVRMPRDRLERALGSVRKSAVVDMKSCVSAPLVTSFFHNLLHLHTDMKPDTLKRMASVGMDLIIASVAECLAKDTPESIRDSISVQKAKHYIEDNLGKVDLTPLEVAVAAGVSLRQLQVLFKAHGQQIGDWLWRRRLQVAAERLADPTFAHLSIGALAYSCGFSSQAHFSRRFRDHFDMPAGEYRGRALARGPRWQMS